MLAIYLLRFAEVERIFNGRNIFSGGEANVRRSIHKKNNHRYILCNYLRIINCHYITIAKNTYRECFVLSTSE